MLVKMASGHKSVSVFATALDEPDELDHLLRT
jgi:hypothetical protein